MAQLGQRFDATQHDTEQKDYSELPNGIYAFEIEASDVAPTSNGNGTILKVTNVVLEPEEFKGRKLFNNYNLENKNPQTQEIGKRQFASLCRAIGENDIDDSEQLHLKRYVAKVGMGKESKDGKYPARAEIKTYYFPDAGELPEPAIDANQPAAAPANDNKAAARIATNSNTTAPAKRPWGKAA